MDLLQYLRILQVIFGVGLVIFVHELGHFLAARRCGVRVEVFSLGFGPKLLAWKRGDTTYQVALVPLGGYVKMAGEEVEGEARPPKDDELGSKSVSQRFLIFAGGVIMNAIFALVVFPLILLAGVPFEEPTIGDVLPGGAAWEAGLQPGTRVHSVDGRRTRTFDQVASAVMLSNADVIDLELQLPGETELQTVPVEARYDEQIGVRRLGIAPALKMDNGGLVLTIAPDSAAAEAGLRTGDVLVDVAGGIPELELARRVRRVQLSGAPLQLTVENDGTRREVVITPREVEGEVRLLGVAPVRRRVSHLRADALITDLDLQVGDLVLAIDGQPFWGEDLLTDLLNSVGSPLVLNVARGDQRLELSTDSALERTDVLALSRNVVLEQEQDTSIVVVTSGSAAEQAGLRSGDEFQSVAGAATETFEQIQDGAKSAIEEEQSVAIAVRRVAPGEEPQHLQFDVLAAPTIHHDHGIAFSLSTYIYQEKNPVRAMQVGMVFCWDFMADAWRTLRGIASQDVSGKNVGGIITIGVVAHNFASSGWAKFFFFLCVLSMNLAFLNVLPIPLLDGGHLFFLLIEKLKGSPVSERVMGYSQLVGLVLILSLFVYVMTNDIQRFLLR